MKITIEPTDADEAIDEATSLADRFGAELVGALSEPPAQRRDGTPRMTAAQRDRLWQMCANYSVPFRETDYYLAGKQASIGAGWVEGWVGGADGSGITSRRTIYVGVDPEGRSHT